MPVSILGIMQLQGSPEDSKGSGQGFYGGLYLARKGQMSEMEQVPMASLMHKSSGIQIPDGKPLENDKN